ncbi:MAG: hypothetical protein AWU58_901 [Methanohalophilus sp. T328-1]|jgi:hypothetical protein|nr:MAG: hypothetical protein AWU58_901 [Methanohalophilus sp. T328-1]
MLDQDMNMIRLSEMRTTGYYLLAAAILLIIII